MSSISLPGLSAALDHTVPDQLGLAQDLGNRVAFQNQEPLRISSFRLSGLVRQQHLVTLCLDQDLRNQVALNL